MLRKPIFDTVRQLLGRGFTQAEVALIDAALDRALATSAPAVPHGAGTQSGSEKPTPGPVAGEQMRIGGEGVALIKLFEGCARKRADGMIEAYPDPGTGGEPWTIGWGATHMDGRRVVRGDVISQARADLLLEEHLESYAAEVARALGRAPTSQAQFDALVSFHFNTGAIARATLTKKHCAGDFTGAAAEFARWNRAGGRVMNGLVRRREAERKLYQGGR